MYAELTNTGPNRNLQVKMMHSSVSGRGSMIAQVYCDWSFRSDDSADDQARPVEDWSTPEQADFRNRFVEVCRNAWSFKWQLVGHRRTLPWPITGFGPSPATVRLNVEIKPVDTLRHAPGSANVTRVAVYRRNELVRAGRANAPLGQNSMAVYASHLELEPDVSGLHRQRIVAHEFGHILGFVHIRSGGNACNQEDDSTYGAPGTPEARDIMGRGMVISRERYAMFRQIASRLDNSYDWTVDPVAPVASTSGGSSPARGPTNLSTSQSRRGPIGR